MKVTTEMKLAPWQRDPGIRLFAPEPFDKTDRMLSLDISVWKDMGEPTVLSVTVEGKS